MHPQHAPVYNASFAKLIRKYSNAAVNYVNPIGLFFQRWWLKSSQDLLTVTDRSTGISCRCRLGAFQMFGETYHMHLYDVPWVQIRPGDLVIDIGANHGFYSLYAAYLGAEVLAFEPQRDTFELLQANIKRNGFQDRIKAFPCAVGSSRGSITLSVSANLAGGMSTTSQQFRQNTGIDVIDEYEVPVLSIHDVIAEHAHRTIRIIKLDCEGSELEILSGLLPSDWQRIDALACELHPEAYSPAELFNCIHNSPVDFQLSTLDSITHYGIGSAMLYAVRTSIGLEALSLPANPIVPQTNPI